MAWWAGIDPGSVEQVSVVGTYICLRQLRASLKSLDGISIGRRGGRSVPPWP